MTNFIASGSITLYSDSGKYKRKEIKMWIYDYKTKREYFASSPRTKFYNYKSIIIEPIPGKHCTILIRKEMQEGRKPAQVLEQLDIFLYLTSSQELQF